MALATLHTTANYENDLAEFIKNNEGFKSKVYLDSKGIATIGTGYAFNKNINTIVADFIKAGISLTEAQKTELGELIKDLGVTSQDKVDAFNASTNAIILSEIDGKNLFIAIKKDYEDIVKIKPGNTLYNSMANTKELIALVDLAYNSPSLIGLNLISAIQTGNRVAAWYEIRYNSNKERSYGLQNRRARESDMFGLYSGGANTPSNDNEAKQVIRFLETKRDTIATYLGQAPNVSISDLDNSLSPAKTLFISHYAQGVNIDGDVIVGQGIGQNSEAYADIIGNINDSLQGTAKNDLIFGERGDDTLVGNGGNDVLIGGSGKDYLDGGVKETIKHMEATTTNFTKTFIYCECESVTKWSDVESDEWMEEEEFYLDKTTGGSSLSAISSSGSITINNFSDGDLGINLSETESIDKKEISKEVFLEEDFCSPLVLDLNGNGINSTRLNESSVYFDMDGDGLWHAVMNNRDFKIRKEVA